MIVYVKVFSPELGMEDSLHKYYFYYSAKVEKELRLDSAGVGSCAQLCY